MREGEGTLDVVVVGMERFREEGRGRKGEKESSRSRREGRGKRVWKG